LQRFVVTIEGHGWSDFDEIELPRLPEVGEPIDTKYGTLPVAETSASPGDSPYAGKIVCRMA
jgi:hypothetical protein